MPDRAQLIAAEFPRWTVITAAVISIAIIGVVVFREPPANADDAVSAADRLMYAAKLRGKNSHVVQLHSERSTGVEATGAETGTTAASGEVRYEVRHL